MEVSIRSESLHGGLVNGEFDWLFVRVIGGKDAFYVTLPFFITRYM